MRDLNRVVVSGNLGRDPKLEYTPYGKAVLKLSLACHRPVRQPDGTYSHQPDWFRLVLWERQAEIAAEYTRRGSHIMVEGRLQTRQYDDRAGVRRTITEIVVSELYLLPNTGQEANAQAEGGEGEQAAFDYEPMLMEAEDADELTQMLVGSV